MRTHYFLSILESDVFSNVSIDMLIQLRFVRSKQIYFLIWLITLSVLLTASHHLMSSHLVRLQVVSISYSTFFASTYFSLCPKISFSKDKVAYSQLHSQASVYNLVSSNEFNLQYGTFSKSGVCVLLRTENSSDWKSFLFS